MIERFVTGKEITVGVLEGVDGVTSLPILELVPKNDFYDYEAKYTHGMTEFIIPARLESSTYAAAGEHACRVFQPWAARATRGWISWWMPRGSPSSRRSIRCRA